jgi:hypothetical protein
MPKEQPPENSHLGRDKESAARKSLTHKELAFCRAYLRSGNLLEAYWESGHERGVIEEDDRGKAIELLNKPKCRDYLVRVEDIDEASVLSVLAAVAFTPITDVMRWSGSDLTIKKSAEWSERAAMSVKKVKSRVVMDQEGSYVGTEVEVEMYDRLSAADKLMKKLHLYDKPVKKEDPAANTQLSLFDVEQIEGNGFGGSAYESPAVSFFRGITGTDFKPMETGEK